MGMATAAHFPQSPPYNGWAQANQHPDRMPYPVTMPIEMMTSALKPGLAAPFP